MSWLLIPAADRAIARRIVARLDAILGYPRAHAEAEVTRRGGGRHVPIALVRTDAETCVMLHDMTGAAALQGAVAIGVSDVLDAMRDRFVEYEGTRRRVREWIADRGWEVRANLPGVDAAWSERPARDGAAGSADGVPIAEGAE
jgi:hypothetical protein